MTSPPAASAPSPTVEERMREAVAAPEALRKPVAEDIADLLLEGGAITPYAFACHLLRGAGPIASALAAREQERAAAISWKGVAERLSAYIGRADTELDRLRASAERMEAAATLALAELDWQVTASAHCGDPNHECPMQDIHAPSDGHSIARSALRAALTSKEPHDG